MSKLQPNPPPQPTRAPNTDVLDPPVLDARLLRAMDLPPPDQLPPVPEKWAREYRAFYEMRPRLLATHRGKYVAIHDGRVVESGDDKLGVALRAYQEYGYQPIYVGLVTDQPIPVERLPSPRIGRDERHS